MDLEAVRWQVGPQRRARPIAGKEGPSQAAVAEPSMVEELEHRVVQLYDAGDPGGAGSS